MKKVFDSTAFYNSFAIDESFIEQSNEQYKEIIKSVCAENGILGTESWDYIIKDETTFGYENPETLLSDYDEKKKFFSDLVTWFLSFHPYNKYIIKSIEICNWDNPDELFNKLTPLGLVRVDACSRVALRRPNAEALQKYMTYGRKYFKISLYKIEKNNKYEKEAKETAKQLLRGNENV